MVCGGSRIAYYLSLALSKVGVQVKIIESNRGALNSSARIWTVR